MKTSLLALILLAPLALVGCENRSAAPPAPNLAPAEKPSDVHVQTPRVHVDVEHPGAGKSVDVKVNK